MECTERSIPLALDLIDTWAEGSSLTGKAIRVQLGTPGQEVLLYPALTQDDLYVYNHTVEYIERPLLHLNLQGLGVYDWVNSSTFNSTTLSEWNGTNTDWDMSLFSVFNDDLQVDGKISLDGFPMVTGVVPRGYVLNNLPLSYVSVFMKALLSTGQILSRVVGYWPGTRSPGGDSSLVLGGFDKSRIVTPDMYTMDTPESCYICTNVTHITFNSPNGTFDLMEGYEGPLGTAFEMAFPYLQLDPIIQDNLMRVTGATWNSTLGRLQYPSRPEGNVTVTIQNNYSTVIINEEFFTRLPLLSENGTIYEDPDIHIALVGNNTLPGQPVRWGRPFLSMNYLIADWSRRQIHLGPAIRERPATYELGRTLTPLCEPQNASANANNSSDHTGAIAGGVVGGLIGAVLAIALGLFLFRRRKRIKDEPVAYTKAELEDTRVSPERNVTHLNQLDSTPFSEMDSALPQEIDSASPQEIDSANPQEIDSANLQEIDSNPRAELGTSEQMQDAVRFEMASGSTHEMEGDAPREEDSMPDGRRSQARRPNSDM